MFSQVFVILFTGWRGPGKDHLYKPHHTTHRQLGRTDITKPWTGKTHHAGTPTQDSMLEHVHVGAIVNFQLFGEKKYKATDK